MGMVLPHKFHDEQTRYECVKGEGHHDHLICTSCGQVEEFLNQKMEEMQKRVAAAHKFSITSHRMEIYGICKACKSKKS